MVGLLQDSVLEKDTGNDGIRTGGEGKERENEGVGLRDRKRCSGCNGPALQM